MKKSELVKVILIIIVSLIFLLGTRETMAANNTSNFTDLTNTVITNNTAIQNSTISNNTSSNNTTNNTTNNAVLTTNNTSNYSNLPKTGLESPVPTFALILVLGISALYAYKKIQDYRNI